MALRHPAGTRRTDPYAAWSDTPGRQGSRHHHEFREPAGNMMGTAPGVSVTEGPKGTDPTLVGGHTTTPQRSKDLCGGVTDRRGGWLPVWNSPDRPSK